MRGTPTPNPNADEDKFGKWARLAIECAAKLAPYQSPTFRAVVVGPTPDAVSDLLSSGIFQYLPFFLNTKHFCNIASVSRLSTLPPFKSDDTWGTISSR